MVFLGPPRVKTGIGRVVLVFSEFGFASRTCLKARSRSSIYEYSVGALVAGASPGVVVVVVVSVVVSSGVAAAGFFAFLPFFFLNDSRRRSSTYKEGNRRRVRNREQMSYAKWSK